MTTAEKTLKWWNDYLEQNKTYPLVAEIEAQLNMAVDNEKKVKNIDIIQCCTQLLCLVDDFKFLTKGKTYKMESEPDGHYVVIDDFGQKRLLWQKYFEQLK